MRARSCALDAFVAGDARRGTTSHEPRLGRAKISKVSEDEKKKTFRV